MYIIIEAYSKSLRSSAHGSKGFNSPACRRSAGGAQEEQQPFPRPCVYKVLLNQTKGRTWRGLHGSSTTVNMQRPRRKGKKKRQALFFYMRTKTHTRGEERNALWASLSLSLSFRFIFSPAAAAACLPLVFLCARRLCPLVVSLMGPPAFIRKSSSPSSIPSSSSWHGMAWHWI